ncbi:MAG: diguanylate cyclase [Prochlorothrix sp.]|nr:diguanylate cyclase [Prochlorothrix sp.]
MGMLIPTPGQLLDQMNQSLKTVQDLPIVLQCVAQAIQEQVAIDRVKIYRFAADHSGEVVAEARDPEKRLPTLLGLHFPAADIPPQARELFVRARQRVIVDVMAQHKILQSVAPATTPYKSWGSLRSDLSAGSDVRYSPVDPCHLQYLQAMGVMSSLTMPIFEEQTLWGLLALHHSTPYRFSERQLQDLQLWTSQISILLAKVKLLEQVEVQTLQNRLMERVRGLIDRKVPLKESCHDLMQDLTAALQADGSRFYLYSGLGDGAAQLYTTGVQPGAAGAEILEEGEYWEQILDQLYLPNPSWEGDQPWESWARSALPVIPAVAPAVGASLVPNPVPNPGLGLDPDVATDLENLDKKAPEAQDSEIKGDRDRLWPILIPLVGDVEQWEVPTPLRQIFQDQQIRLLLVLPLHYQDQYLGYLTFFRQVKTVTIAWAGQHSSDPRDLRPRHSFQQWQEERQDVKVWQEEELNLVQTLGLHLYLLLTQRWLQTLSLHHDTHDTLTHLPNAKLIHQYLSVALLTLRRTGEVLAVGILNLDRFKTINESFGHSGGDQLLREVAHRLEDLLQSQGQGGIVEEVSHDRSPDRTRQYSLGRWHGDSFVLLLPQIQGQEDLSQRSKQILTLFEQPFLLQGQPVYLTASLGLALAPYHGDSEELLLTHAEMAMYVAKRQGKNTHELYRPSTDLHPSPRFTLESDLRAAVLNREFVIHYQPQVSLETGQVIGVEALVRWQHPRMGLITPGQFIAWAAELGILRSLSQWVLEQACYQHQRWQEQGLPPLRMAVNISPHQFDSPTFSLEVEEIIQKTGIQPQYLELEITEESTARDLHGTVERLRVLQAKGLQIALDDFGQGYSCLSALKHFPLHTLKIDRMFIKDIPRDESDMAIAKTITALGAGLGLKVLAEGVETLDQVQFLRSIGCDLVQGYLVSRPLPPEALEQWLVRWRQNPLFGPRAGVRGPAIEQPALGLDLGTLDWLHRGQIQAVPDEFSVTCPVSDYGFSPGDRQGSALAANHSEASLEQDCNRDYHLLWNSLVVEIRQEKLINEVAQKIRQSLDLDDILNTTVTEVRELLQTDRVLLFRFDDQWRGKVVKESVAVGCPSIIGEVIEDSCFSNGYGEVYRQGNFRAISDISRAGISDCHRQMLANYGVKANLVMPVIYREHLWGLLIAHHCRSTRQWQDHEARLLNRLATQAAIAISQGELYQNLEQLNHELRQLSTRDGLTQVANRYSFDEYFRQEWLRAQRQGHSIALFLVDVDCFKQFNDTYGHPAGDRCLYQVAQALQQGVPRSSSLVARYGGEEFAIVVPNLARMAAWELAQRLRQAVQLLHIPHRQSPHNEVTVSIGVICRSPLPEQQPEMYIQEVDQALYRAKAAGRNRVQGAS